MKTIYALSSGRGRSGIAIIRVCGPSSASALKAITGHLPIPRKATLTSITAEDGSIIDRGIVLWLPGPGSATGEDMAEFHIHGGHAVISALEMRLSGIHNLRAAEPGEFSRKAFENGKLDLTQIEGLSDLIHAETEGQRRQAMRQFDGDLGRMLGTLRDQSLQTLAHFEAVIDFPEEEIPEAIILETTERISSLVEKIDQVLEGAHKGEQMRTGVHAALIGAPNVGKSSLLNSLAGRDAAIVSASAGTTRDIVEVHLDVGGLPLILADTAGLREVNAQVEKEGVRRAEALLESTDLKIIIFDGADWPSIDSRTESIVDENAIVVVNKSDLLSLIPENQKIRNQPILFVSAITGVGLEELIEVLQQKMSLGVNSTTEPSLTRGRHRELLGRARQYLSEFLLVEIDADLELRAENLRLAVREIGKITGHVEVDEILDIVFRDFCIGK